MAFTEEPQTVLILAKQLRKILKTEKLITVSYGADSRLVVSGAKLGAWDNLLYSGAEFPNLDQVWPDHRKYAGKAGPLFGLSSEYMALIGQANERIATDHNSTLRVYVDTPKAPIVLRSGTDDGCPEFLLMPVMIRE